MRYDTEDLLKNIGIISFAFIIAIGAINVFNLNVVKTIDYTAIQESKEITALQEQLEQKNKTIAQLEQMQPPDYSGVIYLGFLILGVFAFVSVLFWQGVKEKEIKIREKELEKKEASA